VRYLEQEKEHALLDGLVVRPHDAGEHELPAHVDGRIGAPELHVEQAVHLARLLLALLFFVHRIGRGGRVCRVELEEEL